MTYIITLVLGLLLGILTLYVLRPGFFVKNPEQFQTLETMFDQYMEEMDEKQEQWRREQENLLAQLHEAQHNQGMPKAKQHSQAKTLLHSKDLSELKEQPTQNEEIRPSNPDNSLRKSAQDKRKMVEKLASQGWDHDKIAQHLSLGRSEVALLIQFKKR